MSDSSDSPDLPDIDQLEPEQWLSKIDRLHDELLEALESVLDEHDSPDTALAPLRTLFETYHPGRADGSAEPETSLLSVEIDADTLVFRRDDSARPAFEVLVTDEGNWHPVGESSEAGEHEPIARSILQLVPWWSERAFVDQAGRPEEF